MKQDSVKRDENGLIIPTTTGTTKYTFNEAAKKWVKITKKQGSKKKVTTRNKKWVSTTAAEMNKEGKYRPDLIKRATKAERAFRKLLDSFCIKYTFQKYIKTRTENLYADFFLEKLRLIIEIDGGYHNTPEQHIKDVTRDKAMLKKGYKTIRFTNEQVKEDWVIEELFFQMKEAWRKLINV